MDKAAAGGSPPGGAGGAKPRPPRAGSYTTTHPHDAAAASHELLEKLGQFIGGLGGSLGQGWRCEVKMVTISEAGDSGTCNATYFTPSGKRMRSRGEVAKFLGLEVPQGKGARGGASGIGGGGGGGHGRGSSAGGDHTSPPAGAAANGSAATSPAAAAAAGGGGGGGAAAGGGDEEKPGMTKAEAYAAAAARAQQLAGQGVTLPLTLKNGVVVEALGAVDLRPAFNTTVSLFPVGYRAVFRDLAVGCFVSEIRAQAAPAVPQFVVSLVPDAAALHDAQQRSHAGGGGGGGGGSGGVPGLSAAASPAQGGAGAAPAAAAAAPAGAGAGAAHDAQQQRFQLAEARNADHAWTQVAGLQERAKMLVEAAAAAAAASHAGGSDSGAVPSAGAGASNAAAAAAAAAADGDAAAAHVDPVLAQLLAKAGSVGHCWGKAMFGLADVEVLQLMEALPNAAATSSYVFVDERGGWAAERDFLAKGRWARRSTGAGMRRLPGGRAGSPAAAAAAAGARPGSGTPVKKRPHSGAAAAAAGGGSGSGQAGAAAPKRHK
jgi:hypothetical protein